MNKPPRAHHFVPRFYLAGFTDDGTKEGNLFVVDSRREKPCWGTTPKNAGHKSNFHRIDTDPGGDPMIVERLLGQFEGKWSVVLRSVLEKRELPPNEAFADLMFFIAFLAVRVPRIRTRISSFLDEAHRKEKFAADWLEGKGRTIDRDQMTDFSEFDQTWHVRQMLNMAINLGPTLSLRKWRLWTVRDDAPDLICSESPVAVNLVLPVPGLYSPGFGTRNTVVTVPLNKRLALASMLDADVGPAILDAKCVAEFNHRTMEHAHQLYCSSDEIAWLKPGGVIGNRDELLAGAARLATNEKTPA